MQHFASSLPTPIGRLDVVVDEQGRVVRIDLPSADADGADADGADDATRGPEADARCAAATTQLREYFAGERTTFDLELAPRGTDFQQRAWEQLRRIPFGSTIAYSEQARRLGRPSAVRAVGAANGRNPIPIVVPCHRVVGKDGALVGFAGGVDSKRWLLAHEANLAALAAAAP